MVILVSECDAIYETSIVALAIAGLAMISQ
jgi:hypothetical protein